MDDNQLIIESQKQELEQSIQRTIRLSVLVTALLLAFVAFQVPRCGPSVHEMSDVEDRLHECYQEKGRVID